MSDFDPNDIITDEGSDFNSNDVVEIQATEPKSVSKMESFGRGARQGATLGFSDELEGLVGAGLDLGQSALSNIGLADESPTQVAERLSKQGISAGPSSSAEMYAQTRDEARAQEEAAMKANPGSYIGGGIAGGLATTPFMPGAALAPLKVAKDAALLTKVGVGAANAMPLGAVAGLGSSSADLTKGEASQAFLDSLMGLGTGAVVGGTIPVVGAGLSKSVDLASKVIPKSMRQAFSKAKEGVDVTSPEFANKTTQENIQLAEDVSTPILQKIEKQQAEHAAKVNQIDNKINLINDQTKQAQQLGEAKQIAQNAEDLKSINKETVGLAKNIQKRVFDVKKALGKQFDKIEESAEASGIFPENRDVVSTFNETLTNMSGLPESEVNSIMKKIVPVLGKKDIQSFKLLKGILSNYSDHANPVVRRAAKAAYSDLKNNYSNELRQNGFDGIANKMADTNKRWAATNEMEEQFLSNLKPNRITGEIEASPDTIKAITKVGEKNAAEIADTELLNKLMTVADPEKAAETIKQMQQVSNKAIDTKNFKPNVPELPNPEVARLQGLLTQAKNDAPGVIPGLDVNLSSPKALQDELMRLVPKVGEVGDDVAQKRINQIMDFVKKEQGPEAAEQLKSKMSELSNNIKLRNLSAGSDEAVPTNLRGIANKVVGGSMKAAVTAGKAVKSAQNLKESVLKNGVRRLTESTPEQLDQVSTGLSSLGPEGAAYSKVLSEVKDKNVNSRNAIIFGLMQQPQFRELLRKLNGEEGDSEDDNGETK